MVIPPLHGFAVDRDANPAGRKHFAPFPPSTRNHIFQWIYSAKRPETRAKRVAETVALAVLNRRVRGKNPLP